MVLWVECFCFSLQSMRSPFAMNGKFCSYSFISSQFVITSNLYFKRNPTKLNLITQCLSCCCFSFRKTSVKSFKLKRSIHFDDIIISGLILTLIVCLEWFTVCCDAFAANTLAKSTSVGPSIEWYDVPPLFMSERVATMFNKHNGKVWYLQVKWFCDCILMCNPVYEHFSFTFRIKSSVKVATVAPKSAIVD